MLTLQNMLHPFFAYDMAHCTYWLALLSVLLITLYFIYSQMAKKHSPSKLEDPQYYLSMISSLMMSETKNLASKSVWFASAKTNKPKYYRSAHFFSDGNNVQCFILRTWFSFLTFITLMVSKCIKCENSSSSQEKDGFLVSLICLWSEINQNVNITTERDYIIKTFHYVISTWCIGAHYIHTSCLSIWSSYGHGLVKHLFVSTIL